MSVEAIDDSAEGLLYVDAYESDSYADVGCGCDEGCPCENHSGGQCCGSHCQND